jgi:hypothetical protein
MYDWHRNLCQPYTHLNLSILHFAVKKLIPIAHLYRVGQVAQQQQQQQQQHLYQRIEEARILTQRHAKLPSADLSVW